MLSSMFFTVCFASLAGRIITSSVSEPQCSKFPYEEKLLEKMIRLEISVEAMKKEIEKSRNQARTTLDDLKEERIIWENDLKAKSDKRSTDLAAAIQETKSTVQEELKTLKVEKDKWNSELKEFVRIPELVLFSARNPKQTALHKGLIMVFGQVLMNEGGAYNKENKMVSSLFHMLVSIHLVCNYVYGNK
ncbi:uncharacterized protein LOC132750219, partial [Ruditapes philippinarum]|uniref:uncharacterized protein LOC132750219 n=1 Tax=Ruditapes philippinarum TaxID=129788 RepID=UPI00295B13E5